MATLSFLTMYFLPNMLYYTSLTSTEILDTIIVVETSYPVFMGLTKAFEQIKRIEN